MFRSYLRVALRNLGKRKLYAAVNVFGLSLGLAVCLIVIGHLTYELSFEDFHENKDRICRVNLRYTSEDSEIYSANVMPALGPALAEEIPEVQKAAVFRELGELSLALGEESFIPDRDLRRHGYEHGGNVLCANPAFPEVFTFPILRGDPETALSEPFSVLITESAAHQYFEDQDPIGQMIRFDDTLQCQVTGILKDIPENTQLYCEFIVSYATLERVGRSTGSWGDFNDDYAYLLLSEEADRAAVERKIPAVVAKHLPPLELTKYSFELQPLKDIYFDVYGSGRWGDLQPAGEASFIYTLAITSLFVLLLAVANFVNLSTARSSDRVKEVGVRKVFGARRSNLIKQFLGESFVITAISLAASLVIYEVFKQSIRESLPREAFADFYSNSLMLIILTGFAIAVGFLAGFYPAIYLSKFRPMAILQSKSSPRSSRALLRKALVVFQFAVAIGFVCCTIIVFRQLQFITSMELGFKRDNVLVLDFEGDDAAEKCHLMKSEILNQSHVLSATASNCPPGRREWHSWGFYLDEALEDRIIAWTYFTDNDFIPTFDLRITEGRGFSEDNPGDDRYALIINESAAKELGMTNPIGRRLYQDDNKIYEIVGVVKDFHGSPLNYAYRSISIIMLRPESVRTLSVVLPSGDIPGSLAGIEEAWEKTLPGESFEYSFLDEEIRHNYDSDRGPLKLMAILSVLTITIGSLGILALVSFTAEQRTREIGIRKVLGATVPSIVLLLGKEFILPIAIANAIAWPVAYLLMSDFLQEFAFRITVSIDTFLITGIVAISVALFAASFQAFKAARANPVDTLKYE